MYAMGGGGGGSVMASGSEQGFSGLVDQSNLLAFCLPHGAQSIMECRRGGAFDAKLPGLLNFDAPLCPNNLNLGGIFDQVAQILKSSPITTGAMNYGESATGIEPMYHYGQVNISPSAGFDHGLGGFGKAGPAELGA